MKIRNIINAIEWGIYYFSLIQIQRSLVTRHREYRHGRLFVPLVWVSHFVVFSALLLYFIPDHPMKIPTGIGFASSLVNYLILDYILRSRRSRHSAAAR